ncbi:MAG: chloride channel protein [Hymenobacteraceae bacterium]|nr:chloride channel protein [Hymenobacteraceae bacterium]MDX5395590.1 chloride channel protein [Hymenobacteraceae bacterium]MDX5443458.1 chloride channel protein [Hymenobacteraceae bacterium]MDX5511642.1 chloride channel protein [Hymenobacteraceae bacterium]
MPNRIKKTYFTTMIWLRRHLTTRQFILISSVLVGLTAGLAAVVLKSAVHLIYDFLTGGQFFEYDARLLVLLPLIGLLLTVLYVQVFRNGKLGRGTANILYIIGQKSGLVEKDKMYTHMITSALTVGFGGSAGLESPIVVTGSAIGSNYSRFYHLDFKDRTLLLASGAAAGIAAVFNAPIAGVLFAIEILLTEVTISAFIPLLIAAAVGALCNKVILQEQALFHFSLSRPFMPENVPFYIALGLFCGLVSIYYTRAVWKIESLFEPYDNKVYIRAIAGGLLLGILIFFFPPLFGEGYQSIKTLSAEQPARLLSGSIFSGLSTNEWFILFFIGAIMLLKSIAATITIASGGNGGNFAPSMFVGAYAGFFFSRLVNLLGISKLPESNFTMVGMAGILSGVIHAPLTGIFLIAEITGGYQLMIPLMIVSATAYALVKWLEPYSLDTKSLAQRGFLHRVNKDKAVLRFMKITRLVESDFKKVHPTATLGELTDVVAHCTRNIFPVVNEANKLEGIILLGDIREIMFKQELYDKVLAKELMSKPPAFVDVHEDMSTVMKKFDETGAWNLPVVDGEAYVGFVSKSGIFTKYRKLLIKTSEV